VSSLETYIFAFVRPAVNLAPETTDATVAGQLKPSESAEGIGPDEVVQNTVKAPSDETDAMTDTWADQPLPETNTASEENVKAIVSEPIVETPADQTVSRGSVEAAPGIQVADPAATNELVLWVDENTADESGVQEGSPEMKIP
jgi:hypothetical protein